MSLITNQNLEEYDKGTLQSLAIDLFPILPDRALTILKNKFTQDADTNTLEFALRLDNEASNEQVDIEQGGIRKSSTWIFL